jgi:hypothetical protein
MIHDPIIDVECDKCGSVEQFPMTALARNSWDERELRRSMERQGWRIDGEDKHACPDCVEADKR